MFTRLLTSAIHKLEAKLDAAATANTAESTLPTLLFPPHPSLCARCLTLLYHVVMDFGDGTVVNEREMMHSSSMACLSAAGCVVCAKMLLLFDGVKKHVSFEETLRKTHAWEWNLKWTVSRPSSYKKEFTNEAAQVHLFIRHRRGYGWGMGEFFFSSLVVGVDVLTGKREFYAASGPECGASWGCVKRGRAGLWCYRAVVAGSADDTAAGGVWVDA